MKYYLKDVPKSLRDKWTPYIEREIGYFSLLTKRNPPKYTIIHKNELNASYSPRLDAIIINDKLLKSFTPQEVRFCIGHEMGHREIILNCNHKKHFKNIKALKTQWSNEVHHKFKKLLIVSDSVMIALPSIFLICLLFQYIMKPSNTLLIACVELFIFIMILVLMWPKPFYKVIMKDEKTTFKCSYPSSIAKVQQAEEYNADKIGILLTNDKNDAIKVMKKLGKQDEKIVPKKNPFFKFIDKFIYIQVPSSHPNVDKRIKQIKNMNIKDEN